MHYAAEKQASDAVVTTLLTAHPDAAKEKDVVRGQRLRSFAWRGGAWLRGWWLVASAVGSWVVPSVSRSGCICLALFPSPARRLAPPTLGPAVVRCWLVGVVSSLRLAGWLACGRPL